MTLPSPRPAEVLERVRAWLARAPRASASLERQLALFPERNANPVLLLDRDGRVLYANPAVGRALADLGFPPDAAHRLLPPDWDAHSRRAWEAEVDGLRLECGLAGRTFACQAELLHDRGVVHVYVTDVTEARTAQASLMHQSRHDALTGLGNRASFEDRLAQALLDHGDSGSTAVLLVDVDRLHVVNDGLGHRAGDELLVAVARRLAGLRDTLAEAQIEVFRFQGDAFAALMTAPAGSLAPVRLAQALVASFAPVFRVDGHELFASSSVGVAMAPGDGTDVPTLLRNAELALSQVKAAGGNGFRCYAGQLDAMARDWLLLESGLRHALARGELSLEFQPQFALPGLRETGREALLRWRHPARGMVPPARFIPVAEENGLIVELGAWVLHAACAAAARWGATTVAVNVSARQFREPGFVQLVDRTLAQTGLAPERLELEITESAAMAEPEAAARALHELKRLGLRVAIDDFGTGYSSLSYLKRFPVDRLKLDASFVANIGLAETDDAVVQAIIDLAHRLRLRVVAEGVETQAQLERLRAWGCDDAQGFLFGRADGR